MTARSAPPARRRRANETEAQRDARLRALEVELADREHRAARRLAALSGSKPRNRGHVRPLAGIEDDSHRLEVWRARVERLEALLDRTARKRETRAKIVLGSAVLAEARATPDDPLLTRLVEVLDLRVDRPRDRLAIAETLGLPLAALPERKRPPLPDFEALAAQLLEQPRRRRRGPP